MVIMSVSVNLPLHHKVQKFSSVTSSPGWSQKKGRGPGKRAVKWLWCGCGFIPAEGKKTVKTTQPMRALASSLWCCCFDSVVWLTVRAPGPLETCFTYPGDFSGANRGRRPRDNRRTQVHPETAVKVEMVVCAQQTQPPTLNGMTWAVTYLLWSTLVRLTGAFSAMSAGSTWRSSCTVMWQWAATLLVMVPLAAHSSQLPLQSL